MPSLVYVSLKYQTNSIHETTRNWANKWLGRTAVTALIGQQPNPLEEIGIGNPDAGVNAN
jgi:hypothetical protein